MIGLAADLGQQPPAEVTAGSMTRDQYMEGVVEQWRALDEAEFPFLHSILDVFRTHDDAEQFRAGLDLLLDGLRRQAERARAEHPDAEIGSTATDSDRTTHRSRRSRHQTRP